MPKKLGRPRKKPIIREKFLMPRPDLRKAVHKAPKVQVTLQLRHYVNQKPYGPGVVTVSKEMAQQFMQTEQEMAAQELSLVQQRAFIITAGPYGPIKREVPWQRFDTILNQSEVPLSAFGGTR
jgi:hypothetical protein